jgi:type II secretory pathway pseudopilin PulG
MKRCSTCNRTYTDSNLSFCIDDGTPLITVDADDDATVVTPRGDENDWNARAYQPPRTYVPPGTKLKRRRAWPWVVGILGAFILGIVVIGIAAAFMAPRIIRRAQQEANNTAERSNRNTNSNTTEANTNATENVNIPPPTEHDQVLAQLKDLENEWTIANINADKQKLDRILADDYAGQGNEGELQSKADYLRTIQRDTSIQKWEFDRLKLTLLGDRATLTGTVTLFYPDVKRVLDFTDKFVWRDGRWQATGSEVIVKEDSDLTF